MRIIYMILCMEEYYEAHPEGRYRAGMTEYDCAKEVEKFKPKIETISLIHASPRNMIVPFFQTYCLLSVKI